VACQWAVLSTNAIYCRRCWFATVKCTRRARRICRRRHASVKRKGCPPNNRRRKSLMCRKPSWSSGRRRRDGGGGSRARIRWTRRRLVDDDRVGVHRELVAALPHGRARLGLVVHRQCGRHHHVIVPRSYHRRRGWRGRRVMVDAVCKRVGLSTTCRAILTHLWYYVNISQNTVADFIN